MYFGGGERSRSIYNLQAFMMGVSAGQHGLIAPTDLQHFTEWVATHYHVLAEGRDSYMMILEHVGGDEGKAFNEFFRLLPEYLRDQEQLGREGILSRFCKVQDECMAAFKKS